MKGWSCTGCGSENPEGTRFCGQCGTPAAESPQAERVTEALRSFVAGPVADRLVEAGGTIPEERRLITALFADVSGFTSLADRLDPEELLEVIDPVIAGLSSIVGRYGGYVEKFAGDALLALFGAPVAHEDDATRALLVALEMHAELERMCAQLPHDAELTLHVGVNSGHGIARILGSEARMDYAVLGDSVILAQRLESAAPPGETYVSELTRRLTEREFDFDSLGELTLKGKAEPVPAWRLVGRRRAAERGAGALLGRERELAAAARPVQALGTGRGSVVVLTGEPGIGKSRLLEQVRLEATGAGMRWLDARCLSYGIGLAYWPYADLLRTFAGKRGAHAFAGMPAVAPFFARLMGVASADPAVDALEPEAFRRRLHDAFGVWIRGLASDRPTVLAIDDVHWADPSSLALTKELAALTGKCAFALYVVARPGAAGALHELLPQAETLELDALDDAAVAELVEETLGGPPPHGFAEVARARTGGNPFFVRELVRALRDLGVLVSEQQTWQMRRRWDDEAVPPTVEGVLAARIDSLPREAAAVLQTAAVIGRRIRLPLLAAVAPELGELDAPVDRLVDEGFFDRTAERGDDTVVFHHALVHDVAYSRLLRRRRRALHRRVAEVAEQLYGAGDDTIDLLARHLYLGAAGAKAVEYLVRAAGRAKRLFANEEAILHLERAAEVAPDDLAIRVELADLHELVGEYDDALRLYSAVGVENDVRAARGTAATLRKQGRYEDALRVVDRAFASEALLGADVRPLWPEQGWTLTLLGRFAEAIDVLEAGLVASGDRQDAVVGEILLQLTRAETVCDRLEDAVAHGREAERIFADEGDQRRLATALRLLGDAYGRAGDDDAAADVLRRGYELAERVGNVEEIGGCLINLALIEERRGDFDAAIAYDRRAAAEFERVGHASGRAVTYANLADHLRRHGDDDEALVVCARAVELAGDLGNVYVLADATNTLAALHLAGGRFALAVEHAHEAARLFAEVGADPSAAAALELAAEAERARADEAQARSNVA